MAHAALGGEHAPAVAWVGGRGWQGGGESGRKGQRREAAALLVQ
jgi:hypothetical protein